jgi:hypothetical protein
MRGPPAEGNFHGEYRKAGKPVRNYSRHMGSVNNEDKKANNSVASVHEPRSSCLLPASRRFLA